MIEIRGYLGQETTLFNALLDTLKELGGMQQRYLDNKIGQKISKYPVCKDQLRNRHKKNKRNFHIMIFVYILMSALIIVYILFVIVFTIIKFPFEIFKSRDLIKELKYKSPEKRGKND